MEQQQLSLVDSVSPQGKNTEFKAGLLKNFVSEWQKLTSDENILKIIRGCDIEFTDDMPAQRSNSVKNIKFNEKEQNIIDNEIDKFLKMGIIDEVESEEGEFISSIFVRPKTNGEYRMILNLKKLNNFVKYHHFKMDTLETAINMVKPKAYMASVDLRHAYYSVSMDEKFRKYLRFIWKDKIYQYSCLPNGIGSAPRLFTKIMKVVYATLRKYGHINMGYIDDSLLIGDSYLECKENVTDTVDLFERLGFIVHQDKSVFEPTKKIVFLGFIIDSEKMIVILPDEKKQLLIDEINKFIQKKDCNNP